MSNVDIHLAKAKDHLETVIEGMRARHRKFEVDVRSNPDDLEKLEQAYIAETILRKDDWTQNVPEGQMFINLHTSSLHKFVNFPLSVSELAVVYGELDRDRHLRVVEQQFIQAGRMLFEEWKRGQA